MTVSMRPRRALGVVLIVVGITLVLSRSDTLNGVTFLGTALGFVGVFLGTMRDVLVAHALVQLGPRTWLHRGSCHCGRGTLHLRGRREVLAFARGDERLPVRKVRG
jgi:hypothetical protein